MRSNIREIVQDLEVDYQEAEKDQQILEAHIMGAKYGKTPETVRIECDHIVEKYLDMVRRIRNN